MKKIILWLFLICFILSLLSIFTPLTFNYFWLTNTVYFLTVFLSFFAANSITNKTIKLVIQFLPPAILLFILITSAIFTPMGNKFTSGWRTTSVEYRNNKQPNIYIAQQLLDMGGLGYNKRVAKVISVLPLISWVTITDT
ncbi:MAG: hypothetical protein ACQUYJ_09910, partial [Ferruginibacter sp.]